MKVISLPRGGLCVFTGDGERMLVSADPEGRLWVDHGRGRSVVEPRDGLPGRRREHADAASDGIVRAPAGGRVTAICFEIGAQVAAEEIVAIIELMKAEIRIPAPIAGRVAKVHVGVGQRVERGAAIVTLEPPKP